MFRRPPDPDASHQVRSPGGYEWWYFDAEDAASQVRIVAIFLDGFVFHPGYLRRYFRYLRRPRRHAPPIASEYPCAYLCVYERGRILAQFMSQHSAGAFEASADSPRVRVGPNSMEREADGTYRLWLRGRPWRVTWRGPRRLDGQSLEADLRFRPALTHPPQDRTFLSAEMTGAEHRWILAAPMCGVEGRIRLVGVAERTIDVRGRGYHDHNFGTAPLGPGLRRWMWGRVLTDSQATTFHFAEPSDRSLPAEPHLVQVDALGMREVGVDRVEADFSLRSGSGLAYPRRVVIGDALALERPRLIDSAPFYMRLIYDASSHGGAEALCEIAYPHRLLWPVLGRMIEMSIFQD